MEFFQSKLKTKVYDEFENSDFRKNPTLQDFQTLINLTEKSYYIRDIVTHEEVPCFSFLHSEGLACPIFSDRDDCLRRCKEFETAYDAKLEVVPISGVWSFFNNCASSGCVGVVLDDQFPLRFYNRISDLDRNLPTISYLRVPDADNEFKGVFFGKRGIIDFQTGRTIKWNNYEKSDKKCAKYLLFETPIPGGQLIPFTIAMQDSDRILFQNENTFLGPYISIEGAVAIFSDIKIAEYFAKSIGILETNSPNKVKNDFNILPISLTKFLDSCAKDLPLSDIVLNPNYHRAFQGQFFKNNSKWTLQSVSGVWDISETEPIKLTDYNLPKGYLGAPDDSVLSIHGVSTQIKYPFKRLSGSDQSTFTPEDAQDLINEEFDLFQEPIFITEGEIPATDAYCIDAFDKVSGDTYAISGYDPSCSDIGFLVFPDIVSAASYLSNTTLEIDENSRLNGYRLCNGSGQPGSNDEVAERNITNDMRTALKKIISEALVNGYSLKHSNLIKKLMKDASATCEIIECGYFGDLLYYDLSDGREIESRLLEEHDTPEIKNKISKSRLRLQQNHTLPENQKLLLRSILGDSFLQLTPDTISIAVTALEEFSNVGKRSGYDYAGISMKIAKIFERELTIRVFRKWRTDTINDFGKNAIKEIIERKDTNLSHADKLLSEYFSKKRKTDLGGMRFALRAIIEEIDADTITAKFKQFIETFSNPGWLLSDEFLSILSDISSKYRNGGVHEHIVDFSTCEDAVQRILIGKDCALNKLVMATQI